MPDTQPDTQPAKQAAEDPHAKAERLRAEAAAIEASLPAPAGVVRLKVADPHSHFSFGSVHLWTEYTNVPQVLVGGVMQSAAEAGVTLLHQEG